MNKKVDMTPFVSIVIPVFNEERYLNDCLTSLQNLDYPKDKLEIIIVDNGSSDSSVTIARSHTQHVYIHTEVNVGAVRNHGAEQANGEFLVFIDSDCTVESTWLLKGLDLLGQDDKKIVGGCLFLRDDPNWIERLWILNDASGEVNQTHLLGSSIFVSRDDFLTLGGFDTSVTSGEDSEFSERARNEGFNVEIHKTLGVVHLGNPTTLSDFLKRQTWHAENYIKKFSDSVKDPVFWLVTIFLGGTCLLLGTLAGLSIPLWIITATVIGPPIVLSLKRITRNKFRPTSILDLTGIYVLDFLYLAGRAMGVIKGLVTLWANRP